MSQGPNGTGSKSSMCIRTQGPFLQDSKGLPVKVEILEKDLEVCSLKKVECQVEKPDNAGLNLTVFSSLERVSPSELHRLCHAQDEMNASNYLVRLWDG